MKVSTLRNKFEKFRSNIEDQLDNMDKLADEFDDPQLSELIGMLVDKGYALFANGDDPEISSYMIQEYIDNELQEPQE